MSFGYFLKSVLPAESDSGLLCWPMNLWLLKMIYLSTCVDITNKHLVKNKQILFMITLLPTQFQLQGQIHSEMQLFSSLFPKFPDLRESLHRCWWLVMRSQNVCNQFKIQLIDIIIVVTNIVNLMHWAPTSEKSVLKHSSKIPAEFQLFYPKFGWKRVENG